MKLNFKASIFFIALSTANIIFASKDINGVEGKENKEYFPTYQESKKKECDYMSKCSCSDYRTCCPSLPLANENGYVVLAGEYLYWKPYTLVPYAILNAAVPPFVDEQSDPAYVYYNKDVKTVKLNAHTGYRLNLAAYLPNCWLINATFRQFQAHGTDGTSGSGDSSSIPLQERGWIDMVWASIYPIIGGGNAQQGLPVSANATQRYREKVLDIDFLRSFVCNRFTFNPFMGVRFAWLKADLRVDYLVGDSFGSLRLPFTNHVDIANHLNLGIGLHTGLISNIDLGSGFGIGSKIAIAPLIGQFQFAHREEMFDFLTVAAPLGFPGRFTMERSYKITNFQTNWEFGVDLNWGHHFKDCDYYLGLKVGYELSVWPKFFTAIRQSEITRSGTHALSVPNTVDIMSKWTESLLTHGLNLGARFDF
ncbi:MAG: Lpg1974 family pore-forming outer membrane protein [Chlamydiota bacterium]|jgi:hypothetical protein